MVIYGNARPLVGRDLTHSIDVVIRQVQQYHEGVRIQPAPMAPPASEAEAWERLMAAAPPGYTPTPSAWGRPATLGRAAGLLSDRRARKE